MSVCTVSTALRPAALEYVAQEQQDSTRRMCGAAALEMIYRSFGLATTQAEIWPLIARRDQRGSWNAATYLLAKAAMACGLQAAVVQAGRPWETLQNAAPSGWRVILNHHLAADSPSGHFTVLVDVDETQAVVHDPQFGPKRVIAREELLNLWRPKLIFGEVSGFVLVAIGTRSQAEQCDVCGSELPQRTRCCECGGALVFPQSILGCAHATCQARLWARIFCPQCDASTSDIAHR
jgi:hypothetical protein